MITQKVMSISSLVIAGIDFMSVSALKSAHGTVINYAEKTFLLSAVKRINDQGCIVKNAEYVKEALQLCKGYEDNAVDLFFHWYQAGRIPEDHIEKFDYFVPVAPSPDARVAIEEAEIRRKERDRQQRNLEKQLAAQLVKKIDAGASVKEIKPLWTHPVLSVNKKVRIENGYTCYVSLLHYAVLKKQKETVKLFLGYYSDRGSLGVVFGRQGLSNALEMVFPNRNRRFTNETLSNVFQRKSLYRLISDCLDDPDRQVDLHSEEDSNKGSSDEGSSEGSLDPGNRYGDTVLHSAISNNATDIVKFIVTDDAKYCLEKLDVNRGDVLFRQSAIQRAIREHNIELVDFLLETNIHQTQKRPSVGVPPAHVIDFPLYENTHNVAFVQIDVFLGMIFAKTERAEILASGVLSDSRAARAGLKNGDEIHSLSVDGKEVWHSISFVHTYGRTNILYDQCAKGVYGDTFRPKYEIDVIPLVEQYFHESFSAFMDAINEAYNKGKSIAISTVPEYFKEAETEKVIRELKAQQLSKQFLFCFLPRLNFLDVNVQDDDDYGVLATAISVGEFETAKKIICSDGSNFKEKLDVNVGEGKNMALWLAVERSDEIAKLLLIGNSAHFKEKIDVNICYAKSMDTNDYESSSDGNAEKHLVYHAIENDRSEFVALLLTRDGTNFKEPLDLSEHTQACIDLAVEKGMNGIAELISSKFNVPLGNLAVDNFLGTTMHMEASCSDKCNLL